MKTILLMTILIFSNYSFAMVNKQVANPKKGECGLICAEWASLHSLAVTRVVSSSSQGGACNCSWETPVVNSASQSTKASNFIGH